MAEESASVISLDYRGRVAVLTIDNDKKLNSLSQMQYYDLAQKMREIATHDEVFITVILAKGRYFSAYVLLPYLVSCLASGGAGGDETRRRCLHRQKRPLLGPSIAQTLDAIFRHLQPQHHARLLHAPQDPRRRA
ncbi:hypothetical protein G7046_g7862 [Stylonectria norvegica]|nr:hypothetical protein G7046_g7862 [Stylonectria norvegica]